MSNKAVIISSFSRLCVLGLICLAALLVRAESTPVLTDTSNRTSLIVIVKEADGENPISQARLTLQFRESGSKVRFKLPKKISYSAKTNSQGRYRFTGIPKGTIRLLVTADRHQAFGKEFELEQDNQVIEVRLKKPQPLL